MSFADTPTEGEAIVFTWLADKVLGGIKKAFNWSWDRAQWAAAQDRYDQRIIKDNSRIRILGQTGSKLLEDIFTDVYVLDQPTAQRRFCAQLVLGRGSVGGKHQVGREDAGRVAAG